MSMLYLRIELDVTAFQINAGNIGGKRWSHHQLTIIHKRIIPITNIPLKFTVL